MKTNIIHSRSIIEPKQCTSRLAWENDHSNKEANPKRVSKRTSQKSESKKKKYVYCLLILIMLLVSVLLAGVLFIFRKQINEIFASKNPSPTENQQINHVFETTQSELRERISTINGILNSTSEAQTSANPSPSSVKHITLEMSTKTNSGHNSTLEVQTTSKPSSAWNIGIGNRGKVFIVLFMANGFATTKNVYITSENGVQINITTSPRLNATLKTQIDKNVQIPSTQHFIFPLGLELQTFKKEVKSVLIETSSEVVFMSHDDALGSAGTTTHIPLHKLSTTYVVISTDPIKGSFSQMAVSAIHDNTIISITFKMKNNLPLNIEGKTFKNGDVFYLTLDRFETYQIQHGTDLTGTLVESLAPIAVFSGNNCNKLEDIGSCDHLIEQLPPTNRVDNTYIVPPNYNDRDTIIRFTAIKNSNITYIINDVSRKLFVYERNYIDVKIKSNQTCFVKSGTPILVTAFGLHSKTSWFGDPSMTFVPGINQYLDYYKIVVPSGYDDNYASIIIKSESKVSLRINHTIIKTSDIVYEENITAGNVTYSVRSIRVPEGELTTYSESKERFGLMLSGVADQEAYGFSGNNLLP